MRIVWIKTELLHPLDKGGRIRSYQMLRSLSRQHHVTYVCLDDGLAASDARERAREYAQEVVAEPCRAPPKMSVGFFAALLSITISSISDNRNADDSGRSSSASCIHSRRKPAGR